MNDEEVPFHIDTIFDINPHRYLSQACGLTPSDIEYSMEAFDFILNALPFVRCEEKDGIVRVGGFSARDLNSAILNEWKTQRVANSIFIDLTSRSLVFHSFFVLEVIYILEKMKSRKTRMANSTLDSIIQAVYNNTWIKEAQERPALDINWRAIDKEMNVKLLETQSGFIRSYAEKAPKLNLKGLMLAAPPGTGKTIAGFSFSLAMNSDVTFIVVPKNSISKVWEETIKTRFKKAQPYWISTDKNPPTGKEKYIICHYESLARILEIAPKFVNKTVTVWLDESHNFNEESSTRTNLFIQLCKDSQANHVVWASGTPLKAIGKEAVPFLTTIDPLFSPDVRRAFVGLYGATVGRALDVLNHRLTNLSFKIEKKAVVNNEKEEYNIQVEIPNGKDYTLNEVRRRVREFVEERMEYYSDQMPSIVSRVEEVFKNHQATLTKEQLPAWRDYRSKVETVRKHFSMEQQKDWFPVLKRYEKEMIEPQLEKKEALEFRKLISRYKYVHLVVQGEALSVITHERMNALRDMVPHVPFKDIIEQSEKKTLIFTSFVSVADAIADRVKAEGYKPLIVYGNTNSQLPDIMNQLKKDPTANPLIATYASLSTAVPVIECNTAIMYDSPFRDHIRNQAVSRIDRLGQDAKVHVVSPLLDTRPEDNLTTRSLDIMEWSKQMVSAMMGDGDVTSVGLMLGMESVDFTSEELWDEVEVSLEGYEDFEIPEIDSREVWYNDVFEVQQYYTAT